MNGLNQNLILTATCHLMYRLSLSNKSLITNFINQDVINKIVEGSKNKSLKLQTILHLDSNLKLFTGEKISCDQLERLLVLYP